MLLSLLAQETTKPTGGAGGLVIFLPLIVLFYFFMLRPQRLKMRQHQELVRSVEIGDEIETVAGMFGTVQRLSDEHLWVEIAPGATVKMSRASVRRKIVSEPAGDEPAG